MCPNHAESYIDDNLLKSNSAVERVKLWNKFSAPIDHEIVKNDFLSKVKAEKETTPAVKESKTIQVPPIVKYHYENPPPLLPSLRSLLRAEQHMDYEENQNSPPQLPSSNISNENLVRARAVLTPLNYLIDKDTWFDDTSTNDSIFMRYRSFTIGSGSNSNLNLSQFGKCRNISPKHATIFYDDATGLFELINYSQYGSQVDGMIYTLKVIKRTPTKVTSYCDEEKLIYENLQKILDKHRNIRREFYKDGDSFRYVCFWYL